jgi:hypothetical protein
MKLNLFALDSSKIDEGVWFDYPRTKGVRVRVRSTESKVYQETLGKLREAKLAGRAGGLNPEEETEILLQATSQAMVTDWEIKDEDGNPVAYTPAVGAEVFGNVEYADFYNFVVGRAVNIAHFARVRMEASVKK